MQEQAGAAVSSATRHTMQANRGRDTSPEIAIRSILHSRGLRFRVNQPLPFDRRRRADISFPRVALYVFVDGCFWHGCPKHYVAPKTRVDFWRRKLRENQQRDSDTVRRLETLGAHTIRIWEHEDPVTAADQIEAVYRELLAQGRPAVPSSDPH